jgi:hypothetical protein
LLLINKTKTNKTKNNKKTNKQKTTTTKKKRLNINLYIKFILLVEEKGDKARKSKERGKKKGEKQTPRRDIKKS